MKSLSFSSMIKLLCLLLVLTVATGCGGKKKPTNDAAAKQKAAARTDAIKQYKMLVAKYPDSEFAPKAKERLNVLAPSKK